jgi:hypothetical protein
VVDGAPRAALVRPLPARDRDEDERAQREGDDRDDQGTLSLKEVAEEDVAGRRCADEYDRGEEAGAFMLPSLAVLTRCVAS